MHACSIYKEWKRFREHNTKEVKWCKKTMFTSEKHGNQVTGVQISYTQTVLLNSGITQSHPEPSKTHLSQPEPSRASQSQPEPAISYLAQLF